MNLYVPLWHPLIRLATLGFYKLLGGYRIEGLEHLPRQGAALVACNHLSLADPLAVLASSPRALHYMAARELHEIPVLGTLIRFLQAFPVTRGRSDPEALARCRSLLRAGEVVVIFPEGRCSRDGRLGRLYPGVATLALREGVPVVPAVLSGTDRMLPLGAWVPRCSSKRMRFGPPLDLAREIPAGPQRVEQALARVRQAMLDLGALPGE